KGGSIARRERQSSRHHLAWVCLVYRSPTLRVDPKIPPPAGRHDHQAPDSSWGLATRSCIACLEAPKDATLVVFHTAVLAYVSSIADREDFARNVSTLCSCWISNKAPQTFPYIARRTVGRRGIGRFLLSANGIPIAWADPHGASLEWIARS